MGRIISAAATKHLTPLTLGLGGKSLVILDPSYDLEIAARRIVFGKCASQIRIAPDYLLVPTGDNHSILDRDIEAFKQAYGSFLSDAPPLESASFSRIVSKAHLDRPAAVCWLEPKGKLLLGKKWMLENRTNSPSSVGVVADVAVTEGRVQFCIQWGPSLGAVCVH